MLIIKKKIFFLSLVIIFLAFVFFVFNTKNIKAEEIFYYRGTKIKKQEPKSTLYLTPVKKRQDQYIFLDLNVDPEEDEINTVSTKISFPANKLSLKTINKKNSFCSFFVEEEINNKEGWIKISCLKPYPGIDKLSNVIELIFEKKEKGEANLVLSNDSLVLANDGYGTNVLRYLKNKKIFIY